MPKVCVHCGVPIAAAVATDACPHCGNSLADSCLIEELREALGYTPGPHKEKESVYPRTALSDPTTSDGDFANPNQRNFGEFELLDEIGRGGMGVVYRAHQPSLRRDVAIKIFRDRAPAEGRSHRRFWTEIRAIARLNHPNIVPIYAQGQQDSNCYFAMALVEGCSLDAAIHRHPQLLRSSSTALRRDSCDPQSSGTSSQSLPQTGTSEGDVDHEPQGRSAAARTADDYRHLATLLAEVAEGLAHAHEHGVIHRDVKPQNVLLSLDGRMYISDFGLSRLLDEPHVTLTGELMGTPAYLSPEQIRGEASSIDHRTDIYSFGVTMYELLTGRRPFQGTTKEQVVRSICDKLPPMPRKIDRQIPRDLETITLRSMAKDPSRRFESARRLAMELRRFAAGKPIQTKPPSWPSRVAGGIRRHKAAAGIGVLTGLCAVLSAGFAAQMVGARQEEAQQLLQSAYDQLVYFDYQTPDLVAQQVEQAEILGADAPRLHLVRALMSLGNKDNEDAVSRLRPLVAQSPDDLRSRYLLAWAYWRLHQVALSRETFEEAASREEPSQPDEWFFRGLASHFDRPTLAIEAYRKANELRASQNLFFPQAFLHLARAYNQQMYATRQDDVFEQAQEILNQLIQQGHYGAYPHYLLSITRRLSGDILEASEGVDSTAAQSRFRAALESALLGEQADPSSDRPIAAEAECLERLGLFDEAIDACTRAISTASETWNRCEALHYRWRLYYWTGNLDSARQDISTHGQCMPDSLAYAHVYHCWVLAEAGDLVAAAQEARAMALEAPDDAKAVLWSAACLRFLGLGEEADHLLQTTRDRVRMDARLVPSQTGQWVSSLFDMAMHRTTLDELLVLTAGASQPQPLHAQAYFHAAMMALGNADRATAEDLLSRAMRCFDSEERYTFHARTLWMKLQMDPHWPYWLERDLTD